MSAPRISTPLLAMIVPMVAALAVAVPLVATDDDTKKLGAGGATTITIANFEFDPVPLEVAPDDLITVVNRDDAAHTVTAEKGGRFDTGDLDGGDQATFTLKDPGVYRYFCSIHDYMRGTIRVEQ